MPDEIKEVLEKLTDMHVDIRLMKSDLEATRQIVQEHHTTLYGNGSDGLRIRVDRIETAHKTLSRVWLFVTAGIATLAAWLGVNK